MSQFVHRNNELPGAYYIIDHPSETHLKLKSRENVFVHYIRFSYPIALTILN